MNETTKKVLSVAVAGTVMAGVPVTAYAADNNAQEATVIEETATQNYIVKEGDTLGKIAELFYGNPDYYLALANYNHIKNPALIFPGQIITIPQTLSLQGGLYYDYNCNEIIITGVQEPVQQEAQAVQIYDGSEDQYYTVKDGDTMYCIVSKFYQSKKQEDVDKLTTYNWYFNDKFTDPNKIYRGQVLRIPPYAELQKVQQQDYTQQYNEMGWRLAHPNGCKPCQPCVPVNPCNGWDPNLPIIWPSCPPAPCMPMPPCPPCPEQPGPCMTLHP